MIRDRRLGEEEKTGTNKLTLRNGSVQASCRGVVRGTGERFAPRQNAGMAFALHRYR